MVRLLNKHWSKLKRSLSRRFEGTEYPVLQHLCRSGDIRLAGQILIEFHHKATARMSADTQQAVADMARNHFRLVHTEGRNYLFRRQNHVR